MRYSFTTVHKHKFGIDNDGQDATVDKIVGYKILVTFTYEGKQYEVESDIKNPNEQHSNGTNE